MSLPEIVSTLEFIFEDDFEEKKFFAGIQGIDIEDKGSEKTEKEVMERIVAKANAILTGGNPENEAEIARQEFAQLDIDYEIM
jgi:hypothetical protein